MFLLSLSTSFDIHPASLWRGSRIRFLSPNYSDSVKITSISVDTSTGSPLNKVGL